MRFWLPGLDVAGPNGVEEADDLEMDRAIRAGGERPGLAHPRRTAEKQDGAIGRYVAGHD
jgi:hypothetical protein